MEKWNIPCRHSSLRVAYIDETEETKDGKSHKVYSSVLVKGGIRFDEVWIEARLIFYSDTSCGFIKILSVSRFCYPKTNSLIV